MSQKRNVRNAICNCPVTPPYKRRVILRSAGVLDRTPPPSTRAVSSLSGRRLFEASPESLENLARRFLLPRPVTPWSGRTLSGRTLPAGLRPKLELPFRSHPRCLGTREPAAGAERCCRVVRLLRRHVQPGAPEVTRRRSFPHGRRVPPRRVESLDRPLELSMLNAGACDSP
jgi:hypothetical protein